MQFKIVVQIRMGSGKDGMVGVRTHSKENGKSRQ